MGWIKRNSWLLLGGLWIVNGGVMLIGNKNYPAAINAGGCAFLCFTLYIKDKFDREINKFDREIISSLENIIKTIGNPKNGG